MMRTRSTRMFVAAAAAATLALAACGGDDDTTADPTTDATSTETSMDDETPHDDGTSMDDMGDASVSFASPADGDTVTSPVSVEMAAEGVTVEPAGEVVEGAGHFHIMVDTDCLAAGETIPNDETHLHFGDGSATAELELEAGEHTLCLQLADGAHTALDLTSTITITVE